MNSPLRLAFSHVGLFVTDLEPMVDFYTRVLGFTVSDRGALPGRGELVFLSRLPDEHHQIVLVTGRPRDVGFTTVNQLSFRLPTLEDLRAAHAAISKEPISEFRIVSHGNAWSVYFHDPEGNRIELLVDTPWYTPQPYAEPLDLSLPDDEILRRTEAECRARPGFLTRQAWRDQQARRMAVAD
ncbi:MAG TPA: VOC family protein [Methylomirabilota bacterium]|jgi:catechol 2,3-dioxygenase-like lactoylglutathione lyase family enzyme